MNIRQAFEHQDIFASVVRDKSSFVAWFAFLSALFGLPMSEQEAEIYRACTSRETLPTKPFNEAWLVCGRRAGKSAMMASIAVYAATFRSYEKYLSRGESATVMVIAADRKQARVILRYVAGLLELPVFSSMVTRRTADSFDLDNHITIDISTANVRAVRGYAVPVCIVDEIAFLPSEESSSPDTEILAAIRPAMAAFGNGLLLCAGSPYARRGAQWQAYEQYFGKDDAKILVWQAATRAMNPTIEQSFIDAEYERDPASANAEYGANFRTDVESYLSREVIDSVRIPGRYELPRVAGTAYFAFVDPSGGAADEMTMAIAHRNGSYVILDAIRSVKPPFSPDSVVQDFAALLKTYGVSRVTGDRYGGEWPAERFRTHGIKYEPSANSKSDIYRDAIPLFQGGRVKILDHPKLVVRLQSLERRTSRGGKDSIDHPSSGHDDIANSVCGVLTMALERSPQLNITAAVLARARAPAQLNATGRWNIPPNKSRTFFGNGNEF